MYKSLFTTELAIGIQYDTAVILGWYPLKSFVNNFDKSMYGVAGNLFNPNFGVKLLIRNLLFNTQIKNIVLCEITPEDKTNQPCLALERHLNTDLYEQLGKYLRIFKVVNLDELYDILYALRKEEPDITPIRDVVILEPIDIDKTIIPGNIYSQTISAKTIKEAFPQVIKQIRNHGRLIADIQEYANLSICITDEGDSVASLLSDIDDNSERANLGLYIHDFLYGTKSEFSYSYGDRLIEHNQVRNVIEKIKAKPLTMSAVMVLYHPQDLVKGNSPCLTQIWVRGTEDGKLDMTATFRSNDMFRAWVFNSYALRALQCSISYGVDMKPGNLTTVSFSAHIYQKDFEEIDNYLNEYSNKEQPIKKEFYSAVGNFVITKQNTDDRVDIFSIQQMTNSGELSLSWEIINPTILKIYRIMEDICKTNPSMEIEHILYLYRELSRTMFPKFKQL